MLSKPNNRALASRLVEARDRALSRLVDGAREMLRPLMGLCSPLDGLLDPDFLDEKLNERLLPADMDDIERGEA